MTVFMHKNEVQEVGRVAAPVAVAGEVAAGVVVSVAVPGDPVSVRPAGTKSRTSVACPALT